MPASQEQKVDFLLKKIGYSASKTGIAEDESTISTGSNTPKRPFEEGIPSPLIIPQSSLWADSGYIPTTPPGSDTAYVKGYRTATALRMTRDSTVGTNTRSYIAYTTYNDTSSARLTNWIDTQFGASYIIKVYKGDPNSSGVELQQAGANAGTDGWFFDYSSGILNFNGVNLPSGITATNIYIVGYRYIGATGIRPPAGIGTFESLHVAGISTFNGAVIINDKLTINPDDASTTWQRELDTIHQIRDDIYLESTLNVGDKAGFDFTPLGITTFSYSGTTLTVGVTTTHALAVGKNILIKDSASGFSEAFNTIAGTTGTTVKVTRGSDPSSSLSTTNTKVTVYTPTDPRGCVNVAKDYAKFNENSFNPILRGFVGISTTSPAAPNTEVFKIELKKDASAADHVATLLHSTREFGAGQRIALTIDDGESYPDGKLSLIHI